MPTGTNMGGGVTRAEELRRASNECSGWEPSLSVLQRAADEGADLIDELCDALDELHLKAVVGTDDERYAALNKAWAALSKARGEA